jgi:hypothetical protein
MSGIKVTSLFGSIINVAIFRSIAKNHKVSYDYLLSLGDDIDVQVGNLVDVEKLLDGYNKLRF